MKFVELCQCPLRVTFKFCRKMRRYANLLTLVRIPRRVTVEIKASPGCWNKAIVLSWRGVCLRFSCGRCAFICIIGVIFIQEDRQMFGGWGLNYWAYT